MHRTILLLAVLFSFLARSEAQELRFYKIDELDEYEQVLEMALDQEKMIFVVVYEDGGVFEQMVKEATFRNEALASAYSGTTIPIAVDIYSNMGARMAETFGIDELPAFYYLTNEELLVLFKNEYQSREDLMSALNEAIHQANQYDSLRTKYSEHDLTISGWIDLIQVYSLNFSYAQTLKLALEFFATLSEEELLSEQVRPLLLQYGLDLETPYPEFVIENRGQITDSAGFSEFYASAYSYNFDRAVANEDTVLLDEIVNTLIPVAPVHDTAKPKMAFETKKVFAADARVFHVWRDAAIERSQDLENDSLRALFLFEEGFEIADNFNADEAKKAAMQLAHRANGLHEDFRYKMLESYMAYLLKEYEKAERLVNEAATLAETSENQRKAEGLKRMIEKDR